MKKTKRHRYEELRFKMILVFIVNTFLISCDSRTPKNHGQVESKLFIGNGDQQPLVVGFGGSEGGNSYTKEDPKKLRTQLLENGYAFLAIGYFGSSITPKNLDRISLKAIMDVINDVASHPQIDKNKIALLGYSRGGELVLNLGVKNKEIDAIIAMAAPNVVLPSQFGWNAHSSWTYEDEEIPYVEASSEAIKQIREGDSYGGMLSILEETNSGEIALEKINCPLLLVSAKDDKIWPSSLMAEKMHERLRKNNFQHYYKHIQIDGDHSAPAEEVEIIIEFLDRMLKEKPAESKSQ